MADPIGSARVTPQAALWVSCRLMERELRRKPLDGTGISLAAGITAGGAEAAGRYWSHVEARGDSPREDLLAELRQHSSYTPELEQAIRDSGASATGKPQ